MNENKGFTLVELMIVIAIIGTLAGIAVPSFGNYIERARRIKAISELKIMEKEILSYEMEMGTFPASLAQIGLDTLRDPWGNPYQYLPVQGAKIGKLRKDHALVPVNTDFDLYSVGPDGKSQGPFTAKTSRDDIVRANNGQYVGPVSGY
ncbi:MAG: prepilin-type N-terminal cleavage/methylation domain-containing protein [Desulfobacula sp.]|nr:prepilin-type N-terminal cleavage/methylation domain-containing protein [Desulfobacula sp.]